MHGCFKERQCHLRRTPPCDIHHCHCMQAWNLASPVAEPYREFADRWGNAEFSKYVDILEQQADEAIQDADQVILDTLA